MGEVAKVPTVVPGTPVVDIQVAVGRALIQAGVDPAAMPLMTAHVAVEHYADLRSVYNNNVGNIKWVGRDPSVPYYVLKDRSASVDRYRSFHTLADGLAPYVHQIKVRRPTAYNAALRGDHEAFAQALVSRDPISKVGAYIDRSDLSYEEELRQIKRQVRDQYRDVLERGVPGKVQRAIFMSQVPALAAVAMILAAALGIVKHPPKRLMRTDPAMVRG